MDLLPGAGVSVCVIGRILVQRMMHCVLRAAPELFKSDPLRQTLTQLNRPSVA